MLGNSNVQRPEQYLSLSDRTTGMGKIMKLFHVTWRNKVWALLALQMIYVSQTIAESGLQYSRTLTFADVDPATSPLIKFDVPGGLPAGRITEIIVEVGADDSTSSLSDTIVSSVAFNLTLGGDSTGSVVAPTQPTTPVTCASNPGSCVTNKTIIINKDTSPPPHLKYIYTIIILHETGTSAFEKWSIGITNLPTSAVSPRVRINSAVASNATFTSLVPTSSSGCARPRPPVIID